MFNQYPRNFMQQNPMYEQNMYEQIDNQIKQLQQMREQVKNNSVPTAINQTFQLAPSNHTMKFANTIDDVNKEMIFYDTPFFSKDMSVLWIKDSKGNIKTYELNEIVPKDEKDILISSLQSQIEELKGMIKNEQFNTNADTKQDTTNTATDYATTRKSVEKDKSTSFQKISRSKEK